MKKIILGLAAVSILMACNPITKKAETVSENADMTATFGSNEPIMKFEEATYDFGKIKQGDKVTNEFKFKNIGKVPLIISEAKASCGCTTPEWTREPIKPGETGTIKVIFDSSGKSGLQDKMVTILANTNPEQNNVHLIGEVQTK
ncbi:MAG: DUF1573 domain-containing protein [Sphingobacteriaceae bacterium]